MPPVANGGTVDRRSTGATGVARLIDADSSHRLHPPLTGCLSVEGIYGGPAQLCLLWDVAGWLVFGRTQNDTLFGVARCVSVKTIMHALIGAIAKTRTCPVGICTRHNSQSRTRSCHNQSNNHPTYHKRHYKPCSGHLTCFLSSRIAASGPYASLWMF